MEISTHGKHLNPPNPNLLAADVSVGKEVQARHSKLNQGVVESQTQRIIDRLQGNSDVRNRLLVEIKARVMAGEYQTRTAIERAAEQMIDF